MVNLSVYLGLPAVFRVDSHLLSTAFGGRIRKNGELGTFNNIVTCKKFAVKSFIG
jgi:hypothetical protein